MDGYGDALEGLRLMCQSGPSLEHLKVSNTLKGHVTQIRRYLWDARGTSSSYDVYTPPHMTSPYMSPWVTPCCSSAYDKSVHVSTPPVGCSSCHVHVCVCACVCWYTYMYIYRYICTYVYI